MNEQVAWTCLENILTDILDGAHNDTYVFITNNLELVWFLLMSPYQQNFRKKECR